MNEMLELLRQRSSTRSYTEEKLTQQEIDQLLEAGLQAPTAANRQELHFTVLSGDSPLAAAIEAERNGGNPAANNFYYNAPTLIILSGDISFFWTPVDAGIAVENITLAAEAMGLGSVIIGCIRDAMRGDKESEFAEALHFPEGYRYQVAIAVGHRAAGKTPHTYDREAQVTIL